MDRLQRFQDWARAAAAVACGVIAAYGERYVVANLNPGIAVILLIAVVYLVVKLVQDSVTLSLEYAPWLRQLISGRTYVEGTWLDVVINKRERAVFTGAVATIRYEDGKLAVGGEVFHRDGHRLGSFSSIHTYFSSYRLRYTYRTHSLESECPVVIGYGELHFVRGLQSPLTFSGFFLDPAYNVDLQVVGEKIQDATRLRQAETMEGRKELIQQFIADYERIALPSRCPDAEMQDPA